MSIDQVELRAFLEWIRSNKVATPSSALVDFAEEYRQLGPTSIHERAQTLVKTEQESAVARIATQALRGLLTDIDEHGEYAEYAGEKALISRYLKIWSRRCGPRSKMDSLCERVLLDRDVEGTIVVEVENLDYLSPAETRAWKQLRKSRSLAAAGLAIAKKPPSLLFTELLAAYIGREVRSMLNASKPRDSRQAKFNDVPRLLQVLRSAADNSAWPAVFGPRVLGYARAFASKHRHSPTLTALKHFYVK